MKISRLVFASFVLVTSLIAQNASAVDCAVNLDEIKETFVKHANQVANSPVKVTLGDVWTPGTMTTKSGDSVVIVQAEVKSEEEKTTYVLTGLMECDAQIQKFDVYYYTLTSMKAPPQEACPAPAPAPGNGGDQQPTPPSNGGLSR